MHRMTRILAFAVAALALAACGHNNRQAPLSQVPADTPYLIANLKPLSKDAREALLPASSSSSMRALQMRSLDNVADGLDEQDESDLANLVRAFADSVKGKSYLQASRDAGIDPDGLTAIYGVGLSPVLRGQLSDADKFHAYVAKLEKAYGHSFTTSTLDKVSYQHHTLQHGDLELVIATHEGEYVVALLPAKAAKAQLRLVLGLDPPQHSARDKGRLSKLADDNGYGPYAVGYVDTTRLPALIAGGKDPMVKPLLALLGHGDKARHVDLARELPASCRDDLARIAARVPMLSLGYTTLEPKQKVEQIDLRLAPDIVKAFQDVGKATPGLGQAPDANALADVALALPIPKIRDFWLDQAEAVRNKPFTCPALKSLNKTAAQAGKVLPKLSLPPLGELRGLRVVVDQFQQEAGSTPQRARGRVLIASHNPEGLLNTARAMVPALSQIQVSDDGKPVALPQQSTAAIKLDEPAWIAMDKNALAIGIGKDEKAPLSDMLSAPVGQGGTLSRVAVAGKLYAKWFDMLHTMQTRASNGHDKKQEAARKRMQANAEIAQKMVQRVQSISSHVNLTEDGLRLSMDTRLK